MPRINSVNKRRFTRQFIGGAYAIAPSTTSVSEGGQVTYTVTTQNVADGTVLYYNNSGTTNALDFDEGNNSGSVTISANSATITRTIKEDISTEGSETIILSLRYGSTTGRILATAATVTVADTSLTRTYSISPNTTNINEGQSVTFTIITTNVPDGTVLYYSNSGNINSSDLSAGSLTGSVTINSNTASITYTLSNDLTTEGTEMIIVKVRLNSIGGPEVATSDAVYVADTSAVTYAISPSTTSVQEGGTVTYTVSTQGVADGTTLYWTNAGTTVASDFSDSAQSGSITISANAATFSRTLTNEAAYEGSETIIMQLRTGTVSGTIVATAATVTVSDGTPTYAVSPSAASTNEGGTITWTVTTTNVANSTTLYWTNSGTTAAGDFSSGVNSGSFTITSNSGSFSLTLNNDSTTEGSETIVIQIRTGSTSGTVVATSSSVTVNDTSLTSYSIEYNVIGGGGGGGSATSSGGIYLSGGGGGAGGRSSGTTTTTSGQAWTVTIGGGGSSNGGGSNSSLGGITGGGGGRGGSGGGGGGSGGCGGGGGGANTGGSTDCCGNGGGAGTQGNSGGAGGCSQNYGAYGGGGGGGLGGGGGCGVYYRAAGGGGGGITVWGYAVGGGGGGGVYPSTGSAGGGGSGGGGNGGAGAPGSNPGGGGGANTGGGGGGGGGSGPSAAAGGSGGSGVVIVRYAGGQRGSGGSITTPGDGYTYHRFTTSGQFVG